MFADLTMDNDNLFFASDLYPKTSPSRSHVDYSPNEDVSSLALEFSQHANLGHSRGIGEVPKTSVAQDKHQIENYSPEPEHKAKKKRVEFNIGDNNSTLNKNYSGKVC